MKPFLARKKISLPDAVSVIDSSSHSAISLGSINRVDGSIHSGVHLPSSGNGSNTGKQKSDGPFKQSESYRSTASLTSVETNSASSSGTFSALKNLSSCQSSAGQPRVDAHDISFPTSEKQPQRWKSIVAKEIRATTSHTVPARKRIALVAHDEQKDALLEWCMHHCNQLAQHDLFATGTTGNRISTALGLEVKQLISGPMGGDQQLGALIAERSIDMLIFFSDPMKTQGHKNDIKALLRLADVWNLPVASNESTASFLFTSPLLCNSHSRKIPDYQNYLNARGCSPDIN